MEDTKNIYGRKVFLGGLPITITIAELHANFDRYGALVVDWPHKAAYEVIPPNRYAFLIFSNPVSVTQLMGHCSSSDFNNYLIAMANGQRAIISVKPWDVRNNEAVIERDWKRFERFSVFVGGVHRRATAAELANVMNEAVGGVIYVNMEIDEQTDYPKGAARVVFSNPASYIKAIGTRRITTLTNGQERVIELKPYVCNTMVCEDCHIMPARFLCPEIRCLKYYCEDCWPMAHAVPGLQFHEPMDKNNLHLHTPKKFNAMKRLISPISLTSSEDSPFKLSPMPMTPIKKEAMGFDQIPVTANGELDLQGMQALFAIDKQIRDLRFSTPKKAGSFQF